MHRCRRAQIWRPAARQNSSRIWRWKIFGITWLAYVGFYFTRASFSVAKIGVSEDPDILMTPEQMGLIDGLYLIAYAVGMFIWGILGDKKGTRVVILTGLFSSILAGFAMGVSSIMLAFGVFSFVQGLSHHLLQIRDQSMNLLQAAGLFHRPETDQERGQRLPGLIV